MSKLPIIRVANERDDPGVKFDVYIEDEEFYKNCVEQARKEIPDSDLMSWWIRHALEETVRMAEEEPEKYEKMVADYKESLVEETEEEDSADSEEE